MSEQLNKKAELTRVVIDGESFFRISNVDTMRPFFMSIVSYSNHWMFISSNGGLSAGRKDADQALFPYYTDDKITESAEITGSKTIFQVSSEGKTLVWEPFSIRNQSKYQVDRNLYKNIYGNKLIFEEVNYDLGLTFKYQWNSSDKFGFVKKASIVSTNEDDVKISILDGIQNILPFGVKSYTQNHTSNLVDAYKRNELDQDSGLGIFALSAIIVDKAEPSEALKANVAWSLGLEDPTYLLSSLQLDKFRSGLPIEEEYDVKAEKGGYFIQSDIVLSPRNKKEWMIIADVNKNHSAIATILENIKINSHLEEDINSDIDFGTDQLLNLVGATDGLQRTTDDLKDTRHFANCLFNIMRGGIFDDNYQIEKIDVKKYLLNANKEVYNSHAQVLDLLPEVFPLSALREIIGTVDNADFKRLCIEYMPLKFSRRHGDPSRPWNKFSINTKDELDGSKILDYEGNWRDIFQNWEALALAYPNFLDNMIHKFLNASTFDGYNPYRITKGGIDWEIIEPDDPWSYIGYWGDHQIIYLLKLLELQEGHFPGKINEYFDQDLFVYANVPYKIKSYDDLLKNPKDTIEFDLESHEEISALKEANGADGALLRDKNGLIIHVNLVEKILASVLAKVSNFIPEGGIWMNTQRPEWNDANNALVGNGVSMVTLYYLRRFLKFFDKLLAESPIEEVQISKELVDFYNRTNKSLTAHSQYLSGKIDNKKRKSLLDQLGQAASDYRQKIYGQSFLNGKSNIPVSSLRAFISTSLQHLDHSIETNQRNDNLYHAYNIMSVDNTDEVSISHLSEMLEGQVAVLSSGLLSAIDALRVLDSLTTSALYRKDQYSYLLYPKKELPGFLDRNSIPEDSIASSELLTQLEQDGNVSIIEKDIHNQYHFNGNFKNAIDLQEALNVLRHSSYKKLVDKDEALVLDIFEEVFNHKAFTGRSGTFYGYEGLGSIYWHMVSKLQLAVQECCLRAIKNNEDPDTIDRLVEHYYDINEGIGVHKSPKLYGAFPTDPYSHTPSGKGAQQPGMTGQVKEDIICRIGELGVFVENGILSFDPCILKKEEFLLKPSLFNYIDTNSVQQHIQLESQSLCFTYCQIPIIYKLSDTQKIVVEYNDERSVKFDSNKLDVLVSNEVFGRKGNILKIMVEVDQSRLR